MAKVVEAEETADFETAISACGFGVFNVIIIVCALPCLTSMVFSASVISYVMPTAECDLNLSVMDMGMLNAMTYSGMILSAIPWGFVSDTLGRRPVLIYGGFIDGIFVLCSALSQNSIQLMIFKFFDGLAICGPFAVVISYLAEFHGQKHRHYIMFLIGLCVSVGAMTLPLLAYLILPRHISFKLGAMKFHTWQVFLAILALPTFLSGLLHIFLPESPKFLMAHGYYSKALECFQRIYAMNKRTSRKAYPIKSVSDVKPEQMEENQLSVMQRCRKAKFIFCEGLKQLKPMCKCPYLGVSIHVYLLHFCQIMCVNSIRLWMPKIFATMHAFEVREYADRSMCAVLKHNSEMNFTKEQKSQECDIVASTTRILH
ncbi:PREDICTED: synaptic vesicle glycoprotein 2B [Drosophila arizonae]|uniref:Synaptic vesicle glycoprotein 2B n=1 Tax=Drosophila arizonae TaxID=7263 RepID=A0ABM1NPQ4_DROAR|nr:PREDICTED: synaptic vesicle glycoprotein 2B [Drosophila arizonae]